MVNSILQKIADSSKYKEGMPTIYPKICIVLNGGFPVPAIKGGAIEQLVEILLRENEERHIYDFTVLGPYDEDLVSEYCNFQFTKFVNFHQNNKLSQNLSTLRAIIYKISKQDIVTLTPYNRFAQKYLLKYGSKFDYIINEHADEGVFVKVAKKIGRHRLVNHIHMETFANKQNIFSFQNIIPVSKYVERTFLKSAGNEKDDILSKVLYNVVDIKKYNRKISETQKEDLRVELGFNKDDFIVLFCGRIKEFKGIMELIKAVIGIQAPKIKLLIIGASNFMKRSNSPYEREVQRLIQASCGRIKTLGFVENSELYKYYNICRVGIVPSLCEESFNMVLAEYLSAGLPSIATKSGGMVEVGDSKTTLFVEKNGNLIKELQDSILKLYNDESLCKSMLTRSQEKVKQFDSKFYLENLSSIIRSFDVSD